MRARSPAGAPSALFLLLAVAAGSAGAFEYRVESGGEATTVGSGKYGFEGLRIDPGQELVLRVSGRGTLRLVYHHELSRTGDAPRVRLLVSIDGRGEIHPLEPRARRRAKARAVETVLSSGSAIDLDLPRDEAVVKVKLLDDPPRGGVLRLPNATAVADEADPAKTDGFAPDAKM